MLLDVTIICTYILIGQELGLLNMNTKEYKAIDTGFTSHSKLALTQDGKSVYCDAGSPTKFSCLVKVEVQTGKVSM